MVRIKEKPEDFFVRELKELKLKTEGKYAYFLMRKRNMTTFEAVERISRLLGIKAGRISYAGLKDKRAVTEQYIAVKGLKSPSEVQEENLSLTFLGYGDEPLRMGDIEGNYFRITLRGVRRSRSYIEKQISFVRSFGFENYFGEQRFGSVKHAGEFIIRYLMRGDYEGALREYLTSMGDRTLKKALLRSWGNWREFLRKMPQSSSPERQAVKILLRGGSFREAFSSLPRNTKLMFSFAYQSYLWNRYLSLFVVRYLKHCAVPFLRWRLAFATEMPAGIYEEIRDLQIPFLGVEFRPSNRKIELILREVLEEEGIDERSLCGEAGGIKLLSDGLRRAFVRADDINLISYGKGTVTISFILPPGSYATVLLRKILCFPVRDH